MHIINVYLPAGSEPATVEKRSKLAAMIMQEVVKIGNAPVIVLGDFQDEPMNIAGFMSAFVVGEICDVVESFYAADGKEAPATFTQSRD